MDENKAREEWIQAAIHMMTKNPNSQILILVDNGDAGLEAAQTHPSFIWTFGILGAAEKITDEKFRGIMASAESQAREKQVNAERDAVVAAGKGKAN